MFVYHDAFNTDKEEVEDLKQRYRTGSVGDVEVKKKLSRAINQLLEPIREKRREFENRPDYVREVLREGTKKANRAAHGNMDEIITKMGLYKP